MCNSKLSVCSEFANIKNRVLLVNSDIRIDKLEYKSSESENLIQGKFLPIRVKYSYPVFSENEPIAIVINEHLKQLIQNDLDFCNYFDEECMDENVTEYESDIEVRVCHNMDGYINIYVYDYKYLGGPHGYHEIKSYTYDLNKGRIVTLQEMLGWDEERLIKKVDECISRDVLKSKEGKYFIDNIARIDYSGIVYYIEDGIIHILFNEYELGPYSSGAIDLELCEWGKETINGF